MEQHDRLFYTDPIKTFCNEVVIGLPASLHIFDELGLWKRFFANLSIRTVTSENFPDPVKTGKRIAGAEFCNPIDSIYGHVTWLADKADFIFFPVSLESQNKNEHSEGNYCYYTQYSASLIYTQCDKRVSAKATLPHAGFYQRSPLPDQTTDRMSSAHPGDLPHRL